MQGASRKTEWNVKIWLCRVMIDLGEKDEMAMGVYIHTTRGVFSMVGAGRPWGSRELQLREFDMDDENEKENENDNSNNDNDNGYGL